ncbi:hypothetical protein CAPTEDRAFT_213885 [Capitella teleta]|uniref:G-protein coupled receptors family 1 profile domain-containing protein n=2 Tax=Capitella teleta TaxID=283909 RepID=R7TCT8_CAPTE|nr:hypothetical protein CAPTEDRAFT_213885 [Capitella teleta]|eukprot:ELT89287.1 hypothetical protein CAPTEDRAFT_213885 [Capitella teleta]
MVSAYVVPVVFSLIFLVGVVGNSLVIFIILRNKAMRTTPNIFIGSLALGDLLLLLVPVPFYGMIYTLPDWPHGEFLCRLTGFLVTLSLGVSIFTLTALSADRYMAIMHPMKRYTDSPTIRTVVIAVVIWLVAAVFASVERSLRNIQIHQFDDDASMRICNSYHEEWKVWFMCFRTSMRFVVYFVVPIVIIGVLYLLMARSLWTSGSFSQQSEAAARQIETRRKVAILVLSIVVLFVICWLPRHIFMLWFFCTSYGSYNMFWHVLKIVSFCLSFMNSCVNPLALYLLSDQFRRHFHQLIRCNCTSENNTLRRQSTSRRGTEQFTVELEAESQTLTTMSGTK